MALDGLGLHPQLTRDSELSLWREATQVEACDPYGLGTGGRQARSPGGYDDHDRRLRAA